MTPPKQPHNAAGATPSSSQYHSAYRGCSSHHGHFTHFIRSPDHSHIEFGYWCFSSNQDEVRAFERGYHSPEDLLVAVDNNDLDDFANITLLWIPGRVDKVLRTQICGSPKQHVRVIYEMRFFLGKSLSFQGRVPTYPMDQRLEDYWATRRIPALSLTDPPVLRATNRPAPPRLLIARMPSPAVGPNTGLQQTHVNSPRTQSVRRNTSFSSRPMSDGTVGLNMRNPADPPDTPTGTYPTQFGAIPPGPPTAPALRPQVSPSTFAQTFQANHRATISGHGVPALSNINAAAAPAHNTTHQVSHSTGETNYHNGPFHVPHLQAPPPRNALSPYSVAGLPPQSPHNASSNQTQNRISPPQSGPLANTTQSGTPASIQGQAAYRSQPYSSSPYGVVQSASCPTIPYNGKNLICSPQPHGVQDILGQHARRMAQQKNPGAVSTPHSTPGLPNTHNTCPASQSLQSPVVITDPRLTRVSQNANTTSGTEAAPLDFSFDGEDLFTVEPDEIVVDESGPMTRDNTSTGHRKTPIGTRLEPETRQVTSLKRSMGADGNEGKRNKRPKTTDQPHDSPVMTPEQAHIPVAVLEMPCMDCGEDVDKGHKAGCFLDIAPRTNLTVLDHRAFADCVQRFDPGPWTTHQGPPPEPELEDPEVQIQGMADIIRNEDTYKNDAGLSLLPDDLMILAWAMKTAPSIEIICE